jgi:hypothetical protein
VLLAVGGFVVAEAVRWLIQPPVVAPGVMAVFGARLRRTLTIEQDSVHAPSSETTPEPTAACRQPCPVPDRSGAGQGVQPR